MTPPIAPLPSAPAAPPVRLVWWMLAMILGVQFVQFTLVQPEDVQGLLGFRRGDLDAGRWWTALTYLFVHGSLLMALMNAYVLALFGTRLERRWGTRRFMAFVGLAAVGGWMLHLFVGGSAALLGASATAFGVLTAYAMQWGEESRLLAGGFRVQLRWLTLTVGVLVLMVGLSDAPGGGLSFAAHLGGAGVAWLFVRGTRVLLVERFREGVSAVPDEPPEDQPPRAIPKTLPRSRSRDRDSIDDVVARANSAARRQSAPRRGRTPEPTATAPEPDPAIDAILDKISAKGIDHLTPDERRVLDAHSRRLRDG